MNNKLGIYSKEIWELKKQMNKSTINISYIIVLFFIFSIMLTIYLQKQDCLIVVSDWKKDIQSNGIELNINLTNTAKYNLSGEIVIQKHYCSYRFSDDKIKKNIPVLKSNESIILTFFLKGFQKGYDIIIEVDIKSSNTYSNYEFRWKE